MQHSKRAVAQTLVWLGVDTATRAYALLSAAGALVVLAVTLGLAPIWRVYGWLPAERTQAGRLHITHDLATKWLRNTPDVVFLGGSQLREMLADDDFIDSELTAKCGRPIHVFNAASSSQLLETSWAIADRFGQRAPALVIIAPNLWSNSRNVADPSRTGRALFLLPAATTMPPNVAVLPLSLVGRWKTRLGILFMDAATAAGYGPESTKSPIDAFDAAQHGYRSPGWTSELKLMDARYRIAFAHEISDANFQENVADYLTFAMSRSNLGSRTGFLISPYAPEGAPLLNDLEPKVAGAVRTFASVGAVLDLRSSPDLVSEDFYDSVHLLSSGRRKLWIAIRSYLLANLNGCSSKAGST